MGLAISIVASCREKVWFYDKRKWQNKKLSTGLAIVGKGGNPTGGGCCIWYDEPNLIKQVQARLGHDISEVGHDLVLPEGFKDAAAYGEAKSGEASAKGQIEELQEPVERLKQLELDAVTSYYRIQSQFGI